MTARVEKNPLKKMADVQDAIATAFDQLDFVDQPLGETPGPVGINCVAMALHIAS